MPSELDEKLSLLHRTAEAIYSEAELNERLKSGRPLRVKYGMDPTAPDIHLGHTVQLRLLRQFQDAGHKVVLIIGDYTAKIGDPSGRDTTRPILDDETISANARTYLDQAGLILDTNPEHLEVRRNSEWLSQLRFADVLRLTGQVTVQQMLQRENFRKRIEAEREIAVTEFLYPLMQAYDSVVIEADVEFGGNDQTFNCLMGRDLMAKMGMQRQIVIITPILVGLDGTEKMSKSKGNYVGLTDAPDDMFGKVMSIPDDLMANYFQLLTPIPGDRVSSLLNPQTTHPREAKDTLARVIVEGFYDLNAANEASTEFRRRFAEKQLPSDLETHRVNEDELPLVQLIVTVGFAKSNGEARRLIQQGAVTWGDDKITDVGATVKVPDQPTVLKVGKRRVCRVVNG